MICEFRQYIIKPADKQGVILHCVAGRRHEIKVHKVENFKVWGAVVHMHKLAHLTAHAIARHQLFGVTSRAVRAEPIAEDRRIEHTLPLQELTGRQI